MRYCYWFLIGFLFLLASCVKDRPQPPSPPTPSTQARKVWIVNEGSLGNGNASLSLLLPLEHQIYQEVFKQKNGQTIGDVLQSLMPYDDYLFMAVNNSDKVRIMDKNTFASVGQIPIHKPRYFLEIDSEKIYVSSLFYPEINIINPKNLSITGQISMDYPNTEGMLKYQDKVFACNWDTACQFLSLINPATDQIEQRWPLAGKAPQQVLLDKNKHLWVVGGNVAQGVPPSLTCLDAENGAILKAFHFSNNVDILKPCFNPNKDTLYFLAVDYNGGTDYNGLFRLAIEANHLPESAFIPSENLQYFWALGIDPNNGLIYLGDPKGFIQRGTISVYHPQGTLIKQYPAGVGPSSFLFD